MSNQFKAATIRKEHVSLVTYAFGDPNPIPEFGRLYPYNRFDGYTNEGITREWEMIVLENEFIKLWVNPEVGGKIWGAIEKSTGKEFIYFNHSAKFRDVAMRGPWTSGGMEINMGIIGHAPSCSAPVDYHLKENKDGSVSCFVGATDWPSRTNWTVEIRLPADAAYFITKPTWYNGSGMEQSYYQWNNVGIKVEGDLEYINPGHQRLGHDGKSNTWPADEQQRQISFYNKNDFGEYKSYHIFGSYSNFWGCYWHGDNFGLGHVAAYDDKPGKKIWIWGLSRYGMIWKDLLTDNDGQYCEVQSGRLFNQSIALSSKTPFKHQSFQPYAYDSWEEYWFPVKDIGGLTYANRSLAFYLNTADKTPTLLLCAVSNIDNTLRISANGTSSEHQLKLAPMHTTSILLPDSISGRDLKIWLGDELIYDAHEEHHQLQRPVQTPEGYNFESVQALFIQAKEWERQRFYQRAIEQYKLCLNKDPFYTNALNGLAGILIRQGKFKEALAHLSTVLSVDTYDAEANYLYGLANTATGDITDAKDGFSIAALSPSYRSAACTELAKIFLKAHEYALASDYLHKAYQYNTKNRQVLQLQLILNRLRYTETSRQLNEALHPPQTLDHVIGFELYRQGNIDVEQFKNSIQSELPHETYIETASLYLDLGLYDDCLQLLGMAPSHPMISLWQAYVNDQKGMEQIALNFISQAVNLDPALVFPHRLEDMAILEWACNKHASWKLKYYLSLAYIQALRTDEATKLLEACGQEPDFYPFYVVRANLKTTAGKLTNLLLAYEAAPNEWRTNLLLSKHFAETGDWVNALEVIKTAYHQAPKNYYLGLQLARCLMENERYREGIELMNNLLVLPNEGASDGRNIWRETHLHAALQEMQKRDWPGAAAYVNEAKRWPENLGVGKPYVVDERLENFIALYCRQQQGQPHEDLFEDITTYRSNHPETPYNSNDFLSLYLLQQNGRFEEAALALANWQQALPDDLACQWANAFINCDAEQLGDLERIVPVKREPLPYEIIFEDRSFPFVKKLHALGILKTKVTQPHD